MLKKILCLSVLFTICTCSVWAITDSQFDVKMSKYSYHKNPADLQVITEYVSASKLLENKHSKAPMQGFYMGILHENPKEFAKLEKSGYSQQTKQIFKTAREFSSDMENILNNKQNYYPESPAFLDMLWGYYYATGDERVLKKMCYIQQKDENYLIREAAKWSYNSNKEQFSGKIRSCSSY